MTPEQRAEKICQDVEAYLHRRGHYHFGFEVQFRELMAAQFREAEQNAFARGQELKASCVCSEKGGPCVLHKPLFDTWTREAVEDAISTEFAKGAIDQQKRCKRRVAEAYEDAAEIAEEISDRETDERRKLMGIAIANEIIARAKEVGK